MPLVMSVSLSLEHHAEGHNFHKAKDYFLSDFCFDNLTVRFQLLVTHFNSPFYLSLYT